MALIPNFYIESVVTISVLVNNTTKKCIGTGFLVGDLMENDEGSKKYGLYLITNKHVVRNQNQIFIGFNQNGGTASYDFPVNLTDGQRLFYSEHVNPKVDIIALSINASFLNNMNAKYHFFPLDEQAFTIAEMKLRGVFEGDLVYSLGYPLNLGDTSQKNPICRLGCISRISDLYIEGNPEVNFLVDAQSFPGNSGGPVILRPELTAVIGSKPQHQSALIGILHSYIPYQDALISRQTGETYSIMQENSGLTNVHPVDYIIHVVQLERNRIGEKNISRYEMIIPKEQPNVEMPNQDTVKKEETIGQGKKKVKG
ncbi:MAG: trypsin-like peptidase domain-containing protein [Clostridia bacterium]|nr:trypsin-like peptidase domain-containing protein [Clostridia bacterium]